MHNPNPFDFVPFASRPFLRPPEIYDTLGDYWSGFLEVTITALTPVHVVGYQQRGRRAGEHFFYVQDDRPCIPAATIRGCLRSFVEALTSGWVSQATAEYPKEYQKRHIGFRTFEEYENKSRSGTYTAPRAVEPDFKPRVRDHRKIDVASYLFGMVIEPEAGTDAEHEALARKGKVRIEDAFIDPQSLVSNKYWVPDLDAEAFMGGAKPSASNWWYLAPGGVRERRVRGRSLVEFIGVSFRGRKFYYHQDPLRCVQYYHKASGNWSYSPRRDFYPVQLQCVPPEASTDRFRIYFDKVPEILATLLVHCLLPGDTIRHKLGYGKAYGYGSIAFSVEAAQLRKDTKGSRLPAVLQDMTTQVQAWHAGAWTGEGATMKVGDDQLVDPLALEQLACILGWQDYDRLLFTYPPFDKKYFMQPVYLNEFQALLGRSYDVTRFREVEQEEGNGIAAELFDVKKPIDFRYYQKQARGWDLIVKRKP